MKKLIFSGCGVAIATPMNKDLSVNFDELGRLIDFEIKGGMNAIIICGTTGESATLSHDEHCKVVRYAVEKVAGRVPVIAGAGSNNTAVAIEYARHARDVGADAILVVTPYYNKTSQKGLVEHFNAVADSCGLPTVIYNVPSRTACNVLPETYFELSKNPNIVAVKESNGDFSAIAKTMALCGDELTIYSGNDDQALPIIAMGGKGVISVLANICPAEMSRLAALSLAGKLEDARALNYSLIELMNLMFSDVNPIPVKEALNIMGFDCGRCRMPLSTISEKNRTALINSLRKYGKID